MFFSHRLWGDYELVRAADRAPRSLCHDITYFNRVGEAKREDN